MPTPELLGSWADKPSFYVSILDAGKFAAVAGPFRALPAAVAALPVARRIGASVDPKSVFYAWGTVKLPNGYRDGRLNASLAQIDARINCGEWNFTDEHVREAARLEEEAEKQTVAPEVLVA